MTSTSCARGWLARRDLGAGQPADPTPRKPIGAPTLSGGSAPIGTKQEIQVHRTIESLRRMPVAWGRPRPAGWLGGSRLRPTARPTRIRQNESGVRL